MFAVVYYETEGGRQPFGKWFDKLDAAAAARVATALGRMADGHFGDFKSVGGGVLERRIGSGPGYRLYYGRDGENIIVLLCGGTKRRQSTDIERAQNYWANYQRRR